MTGKIGEKKVRNQANILIRDERNNQDIEENILAVKDVSGKAIWNRVISWIGNQFGSKCSIVMGVLPPVPLRWRTYSIRTS